MLLVQPRYKTHDALRKVISKTKKGKSETGTKKIETQSNLQKQKVIKEIVAKTSVRSRFTAKFGVISGHVLVILKTPAKLHGQGNFYICLTSSNRTRLARSKLFIFLLERFGFLCFYGERIV